MDMRKVIAIFMVILTSTLLNGQVLDTLNGKFELVRLKYGGGGDWYNGPSELPNLAKYVQSNAKIPIFTRGKFVEPLSNDLFNYPFIFLTGHGNITL